MNPGRPKMAFFLSITLVMMNNQNKKVENPALDFEQKLLSFASIRNENILRILGVSRASSLITPSLISNSTDHFIDLGLELADGNLNDLLKSGINYSASSDLSIFHFPKKC